MEAWCGRRETTAKVLKDRRSPRERGRMETSVRVRRTRLRCAASALAAAATGILAAASAAGASHSPTGANFLRESRVRSALLSALAPRIKRARSRASSASGSFHTSERRGGVERRQLALKGIDGGD